MNDPFSEWYCNCEIKSKETRCKCCFGWREKHEM
jgi:hypothetical protein